MKYKIWDRINEIYLDLTKYCVNGFGDIMTVKGDVLLNKDDFRIEVEFSDNITKENSVWMNLLNWKTALTLRNY